MLDGLSVWAREIARAQDERSPTVIRHERSRSARMADLWEAQIDHTWMRGPFNMAQITLACALGFEARIPELVWRPGRPKLGAWFDQVSARPSFASTVPPADH
jgi:glutathione S-transferase